MKRLFTFFLTVLICIGLCACSVPRPEITTRDSLTVFPEDVLFISPALWPGEAAFHALPIPGGTIDWVLDMGDHWGIQVSGLSKSQFSDYYEALEDAGFQKIDVASQGSVSIGTLLSDGNTTVSLAYSQPVLMLTVSAAGLAGKESSLFRSGNLINVYSNAYSTYDTETGIGVVTELYVSQKSDAAPGFSRVFGIITVTIGDTLARFPLCSLDPADGLSLAVRTGITGASGEKGTVTIAGTAFGDNAAGGCGSFCIQYEITLP